jgi:DNA-binding transcriptional ArsR family regulator
MADFLIDTETLAQARFDTSELAECVGALGLLLRSDPLPWHRDWRAQHIGDLQEHLAEHPVQAAIAAHAMSPNWAADFLTVPPTAGASIEDHLADIEALGDERILIDLERVRRPLAPALLSPGVAGEAAELLRWVWHATIAPEWTKRRRILAADLVARTNQLTRSGWAGVFNDLRGGTRWLGDNRLQYDPRPYPDIDLRGSRLTFYAAHCRGGWVMWDRAQPDSYGIVYPVTGILADNDHTAREPLRALLGPRRAIVFQHTQNPIATSSLAASTGLPLSTVAAHLRVLREAGLLHRRRSGHKVLYWWTDAARTLNEASPTESEPSR